jgi:cyanophycinase
MTATSFLHIWRRGARPDILGIHRAAAISHAAACRHRVAGVPDFGATRDEVRSDDSGSNTTDNYRPERSGTILQNIQKYIHLPIQPFCISFLSRIGELKKQKRIPIILASMLSVLVVLGNTCQQLPNTAAMQVLPEYGPAKGTLVIVGGGSTDGTGIMETFINLAGGPDAKFVILPTAGGNKTTDGQIKVYNEETVVANWKKRGLKNVRMVHTHDPKIADTEEFIQPLREANAVWFVGGRQWNIVDSYMNTAAYREFHKVLERGGVIGGSSAGATIQGDYLVRGAIAGSQIMMTPEPEHEHGFSFLRKTAIDQHINARNRWDDLIPVIKKYPNLLGIGLSEGTAIIVKGDRFEVIGSWKVAIHDNSRAYQPWEKPYYVLSEGDVYNMKTRQVEKYGNGTRSRARPRQEAEQSRRDPEKP